MHPASTETTALELRAFQTWDEIGELRPAWEALLAESASQTIFLTWEWLKAWWDAYGASRRLLFLTGWDSDRRLAGIAPLYRSRREAGAAAVEVLQLLGDGSTDSDNLDFLVQRGREPAFLQAVLDWLAQHSAEWDILELNTVPEQSPVATAFQNGLLERHWHCWRRETDHDVIPLPPTWDAYLQNVSKNMRSSINSKLRRLEKRYPVRLRRCEALRELDSSLEKLYEMHASRWRLRDEPGSFRLPERRKFYSQVARDFLDRGWLDFWLLDCADHMVAAEFGFHYGETYFFLQSGFDSGYASESVGFVQKALVLRELIGKGLRYYDFLGGGDPYKSRWGAVRSAYLHLCCARPRSRGAMYLGLARSAERGKTWLRSRLPEPARKILRGAVRRLRTAPSTASDAPPVAASEVEEKK